MKMENRYRIFIMTGIPGEKTIINQYAYLVDNQRKECYYELKSYFSKIQGMFAVYLFFLKSFQKSMLLNSN